MLIQLQIQTRCLYTWLWALLSMSRDGDSLFPDCTFCDISVIPIDAKPGVQSFQGFKLLPSLESWLGPKAWAGGMRHHSLRRRSSASTPSRSHTTSRRTRPSDSRGRPGTKEQPRPSVQGGTRQAEHDLKVSSPNSESFRWAGAPAGRRCRSPELFLAFRLTLVWPILVTTSLGAIK